MESTRARAHTRTLQTSRRRSLVDRQPMWERVRSHQPRKQREIRRHQSCTGHRRRPGGLHARHRRRLRTQRCPADPSSARKTANLGPRRSRPAAHVRVRRRPPNRHEQRAEVVPMHAHLRHAQRRRRTTQRTRAAQPTGDRRASRKGQEDRSNGRRRDGGTLQSRMPRQRQAALRGRGLENGTGGEEDPGLCQHHQHGIQGEAVPGKLRGKKRGAKCRAAAQFQAAHPAGVQQRTLRPLDRHRQHIRKEQCQRQGEQWHVTQAETRHPGRGIRRGAGDRFSGGSNRSQL
mmetsp:Transcript_9717/g.58951  ORF Transcript_9717/g.58951 Transcript_9717/m.58951 type:complete len:289 (-) Transcript_9717:2044-2910(-)